MKKRRLKTLSDVRRWLADTANRLEHNEIDTNFARTVAYVATVMSGIIQNGDLETRIEKLEKTVKKKG